MTPTIGRIVIYTCTGGVKRPAIITHVWSEVCVNLVVFEPYAGVPSVVYTSVLQSPDGETEQMWAWPSRQ